MSKEHCLMCFEALDAELNKRKPLSLSDLQTSYANYLAPNAASNPPKDPALRRVAESEVNSSSSSSTISLGSSTPATSTSSLPLESAPLFVTWNTVSPAFSSTGDDRVSLRGCIGTFEAQPLSEGIPEYAVISALQDSRFPPVSKSEISKLQACVTLLTDFEPVSDPYDWEVGKHGVRLSFTDKGRRYGSTYLPDVASEQGWTKEEALYSLVRKAGWSGSRSKWEDLELNVTRYQGKKDSMNYVDYKKWRDWEDGH